MSQDGKIPPPTMPWVHNLYDAEDGLPTLQSEMGLIDDPNLFSDTLANIREIWRQHGVDRNVAYRQQDSETMSIVKERALNEMPFLRDDYEDGWPVTIYLQRSLQNRMTTSAQREFDEAPYRYRGRRFVVVDPNEQKVKLKSTSPTWGCSVKSTHNPVKALTRIPAHRRRGASTPSSLRRGQSITSILSSAMFRSPLSTSPRTPPASSSPSSSRSVSFSSSSPRPMKFRFRRPGQVGHQSVLDLLRTSGLLLADAEHIVGLLAASGVSNMAYMRVFARMESTQRWLRRQRDKRELTEFEMRLLREILRRLARE